MADDSIINYSDLIGKDATFDDLSNEIDNLKAELMDLAKVYQKALSGLKPSDTNGIEDMDNKIKELIVTQKNLLKVEGMARKAKKKNIELTQEQLIQAQSEKMAQRERVKEAKQLAILRNAEKGSIEALRAQLALTTTKWKALSNEERENGREGKKLVKDKRKLTEELKRLEKQTGDTRRNVGNYSDSLSKLGKVATRVFIGRTAVDFFRKIATGTQELIEANKEADSTIGALDTAFGRFARSGGSAALNVLKFFAPLLTTAANGVADFLEFVGLASSETEEFTATSKGLGSELEKLNGEFVKESAELNQVFTALGKATEGSKERKEIIDQINKQYGKYLPNLLSEKSTINDIAAARRASNDALAKEFLLKKAQATQTSIFEEQARVTVFSFKRIVKAAKDAGVEIEESQLGAFQVLTKELSRNGVAAQALVDSYSKVSGSGKILREQLDGTGKGVLALALQISRAAEGSSDLRNAFTKIVSDTLKFDKALDTSSDTVDGIAESIETFDHGLETSTEKIKKNTVATTSNADARLAAIEKLRDAAANAEAESIEDATERALALEKLRFDRLEKLRLEQLEKDIKLFKGNDEKIKEIQALNYTIAEKNLTDHEEKKLEIRKKFALETANLEVITEEKLNQQREKAIDDELKQIGSSSAILKKQQEEIAAENNKAIEEAQEQAAKKTEQRQKELFDSIGAAAKKLSAIVSDLFKKQVDQASNNVEEQEKNLQRTEERAQQGLSANIAFERKELADRQSERLKREKEAATAAKLTTLFNLVSAYAQGGDQNALFRGLADFALLTSFEQGIQGFFDGTENVERDLGGASKFFQGQRDAYLGVTNSGKLLRFDGKERIFNPAQNALLGGMSNEEAVNNALVGSWVSDNFQASSIMGNSIFGTQKANFETAMKPQKQEQDSRLIQEVRALRQAVSSKPSSDVDMVKVYKNITDLVKREVKSAMTRTSKKRLS